jgi:hypothetical protein
MNKDKSTWIRISAITFMVILGAAVSAGARVFPAPSWYGDAGTTSQQWSFTLQGSFPQSPDLGFNNSYGTPQLSEYSSAWNDTIDGHQGVWTFSGFGSGMLVDIPNNPVSQPTKQMQVELIWEAAGLSSYIPDQPIIGVWADHFTEQLVGEQSIGGNWKASLYKITIWPNPSSEQITINGDIRLDQIIVDTICIPEPATFGLLIGGAFMAFRKKQKKS